MNDSKLASSANPTQLAKICGCSPTFVLGIIEALKLQPEFELPYGRGTMRVYRTDEAVKAIRAELARRELEAAQAVARAAGIAPAEPTAQAPSDVLAAVETIRREQDQQSDAIASILLAIDDIKSTLAGISNGLSNLACQRAPQERPVQQALELLKGEVVDPEFKESAKQKIAVFGINAAGHRDSVLSEFGSAFDITFYDGDKAAQPGIALSLARFNDIVVMGQNCNKGLRGLEGVHYTVVHGSTSQLKRALNHRLVEGSFPVSRPGAEAA